MTHQKQPCVGKAFGNEGSSRAMYSSLARTGTTTSTNTQRVSLILDLTVWRTKRFTAILTISGLHSLDRQLSQQKLRRLRGQRFLWDPSCGRCAVGSCSRDDLLQRTLGQTAYNNFDCATHEFHLEAAALVASNLQSRGSRSGGGRLRGSCNDKRLSICCA